MFLNYKHDHALICKQFLETNNGNVRLKCRNGPVLATLALFDKQINKRTVKECAISSVVILQQIKKLPNSSMALTFT